MAEAPEKRLTLDDPVGKEALEKLSELESAEVHTSLQLMAIKQEEVKLVAAGRRIEDERNRIFQKLLMDRGLPPNMSATIDGMTGKITILGNKGQTPQAPSGAPAEPQTGHA